MKRSFHIADRLQGAWMQPGAAMPSASGAQAALMPTGAGWLFVLVTSLFFLWGVPNSMNDVLIRQFMKSLAISRVEAGLVQSA